MKNINKLLLIANVVLCGVIISSFTMKTSFNPGGGNDGTIPDRAAAQKLYADFNRKYSAEDFAQHGGQISKTVLQNMLGKMTDSHDTKVFYIFGRTADEKNCIMLFNDPAYNDVTTTTKYMTIAPYCPEDCNQAIMTYIGE